MIAIPFEGKTSLIFIGLNDGDLLLESIRKGCRDNDIESGIIVSGAAAIKTADVHYIDHSDYPPRDITHTVELPMEMTSISGIIIDYEPHVHIGLISGVDKARGGHLEEGTRVAYRGELAIMKCHETEVTRVINDKGIAVMAKKGAANV
jgi:predicted DNA-binding protein with PD1-like motif